MTDSQIVLTPGTDESFVPLSRTQQGRVFKKEILRTGPLYHPKLAGGKVDIDEKFLDKVVENFNAGVVGHVQTTVVGKDNKHSEDPRDNIGEVIQLRRDGDKLYSFWDVRDETMVPKMGKTILGASAMLDLNRKDTRTNEFVGPAIVHAAATNNPHVLDMESFEAVVELSVDSSSDGVLMLSNTPTTDFKESTKMETLDEILDVLKDEHNIDVRDLQAKVEANSGVAELSAQLSAALGKTGVISLSNGEEASAEDLVLAVGQLADDKVELSNRVEALELSSKQSRAEAQVDSDIKDGFVLPAKRDAMIKIFLSSEETYNEIKPEQPILNLSGESNGIIPVDEDAEKTVQTEVERYLAIPS